MEYRNIILFEDKVSFIKKDGELLYNLEELLKYFSKNIVHIDPLIQNIKKTHPYLNLKVIKDSSSLKNKYYLNTLNVLRFLIYIETKEALVYKEWMIKCAIERINEIVDPRIIYDRLKTILYKKGVRTNYSFVKSEINKLNNKINYVELDQSILKEDIKTNIIDLSQINTSRVTVVKLPRNPNSTNIL